MIQKLAVKFEFPEENMGCEVGADRDSDGITYITLARGELGRITFVINPKIDYVYVAAPGGV